MAPTESNWVQIGPNWLKGVQIGFKKMYKQVLNGRKSPEIAGNLFQLYEFARQQVIKGFTQKDSVGVKQAMEVIREILNGWKEIPFEERKI